MAKFAFWRSASPARSEIIPLLNDEGLMLCIQGQSGTFQSREVRVPSAWRNTDRPWYVGRAISLSVDAPATEPGGQGVRLQARLMLLMTGAAEVPVEGVPENLSVYEGSKEECDQLLADVRQAWLEANHGAPAVTSVSRRPAPVRQPRRAVGRVLKVGAALLFVGFGAVGMHLYLSRGGPGLDLTSMSVDDVAALDSNPLAVRKLQDQMMVAMKTGQEEAKKMTGKIEEDHVAALKAMGLEPGVSVKNAMACLATK